MAVPTITITCSSFTDSTSKEVICSSVTAGHKRDIIANPNAVGTAIVEAQTQSYENPTYTLQNIKFTDASGTFTYKNAVELMKHQYDGTNAPVLTITYGTGGAKTVTDNTGSTSGISVVAKSFNAVFNAQDTRDAYIPTGTLILQETA